MHPAAEVVRRFEMGVVGGDGREAVAFVEHLVEQVEAFTQIIFDGAAVVINFDGMGKRQCSAIFNCVTRPRGVGDGDESSGGGGTKGKLWAGFALCGGCKIQRQTCGNNMPEFTSAGDRGVQFSAQYRGEVIAAQMPGICDRPVEVVDEVLRHHHEIIPHRLVAVHYVIKGQGTIGQVGMGVEIAAPKATGCGERSNGFHVVNLTMGEAFCQSLKCIAEHARGGFIAELNREHMITSLTIILDWLGVLVFAASGGLVASRKRMDIVGFALLASVTAVGGGTVRDVVLGLTPVFWVRQPAVLLVSVSVGALMFFMAHLLQSRMKALLWLDALGLAVFSVTGAHTALDAGAGPSIAIAMGVASATFGGIIRDVLGGESPIVLRKEIYVTAALFGALTATLVTGLGYTLNSSLVAGFAVALTIRAAALYWNLSLPRYEGKLEI